MQLDTGSLIVRRILARLIDVAFVSVIYYALAMVSKSEAIEFTPVSVILPQNFICMYVTSLLIFFLSNIILIVIKGQTIGKKLVKIKVVTQNENEVVSMWKFIFIRELSFYSGITLFVFFALSFEGAPIIPDKIAGTHVIHER